MGADGSVYIADGASIRAIDGNTGRISTLAGSRSGLGHWQPWSCDGSVPVGEAALKWPTDLAVNPLDGTLHFVDDNLVIKVTRDRRLQVIILCA